MKRILLINTNTEKMPYPVPPMGLCLVAASLSDRYTVRVYDGTFDEGEQLPQVITDFKPHYIGLGIRNIDNVIMTGTSYYPQTILETFVKLIRSITKVPLILGGSGFSILPCELMTFLQADYGVVGEGEKTAALLLDTVESGGDAQKIPGVICRNGEEYRMTDPSLKTQVGELSRTDLDLFIDFTPYIERGSYPLQTKRGCSLHCLYCTYPWLEGCSYRLHPPESIVNEMEDIRDRFGDVMFEFVDSTFNIPTDHAEEICREIIRRDLGVRIRTMGINPKGVTDTLLSLMKQAGFIQMDCTPDTASPAILSSLKKGFSLSVLQRCAALISRHDMPTMWFFLFGGPGETEETVVETFSFIDTCVSRKDMVYVSDGIRILPQTGLHAVALQEGIIRSSDSLLEPVFYVSPTIGKERLSELLANAVEKRPNVIHAADSMPDPGILKKAADIRRAKGLKEPMFRTLLRLSQAGELAAKKRDKRVLNILLVNPPRSPHNSILHHAPDEAKPFIHKKLIGPPLGLLTVAAAVTGHQVTLLDMKGEYDLHPKAPDLEALILSWLKQSHPHIVGVTFIASEFNDGMRIFKTVKKWNPAIITVAGGLHATLCTQHFNDSAVDIVVPGMGVHTFGEIVEAVAKRKDLDTVSGIYINKNGTLQQTRMRDVPGDPAGTDFIEPDRSFIKPWISTYTVGNAIQPATYLYTSLGCPYYCTFCSIWPQFNGKFYQRDVESIITELKNCDDYPIVRFADANTVVHTRFVEQLFQRIVEEGIQKEYVMDIRFDTVVQHPELIETMAQAGLRVAICGFESFRQEELEQYNKKASASQIAEAISIFDANGIMVRGNYVVQPEYTSDDFDALAAYAASHKVVYAGYTILTPMPGTELYNERIHDIIDHDLAKYNFFNCVMKTRLPLEEFYHNVGKLWMIKRGADVI